MLMYPIFALLLSTLVSAGLYTRNSPVLQVDASSYDRVIAKSNYTSIVEFYAPWCGHCQKLTPAFESAAKRLNGLAKVAAINCDEESNRDFCGRMGVKGYPTLKLVRPSAKKGGRLIVEDYMGERSAKGIADAVIENMPNHIKRLTDGNMEAWLEENNATTKAVLLTEKGVTSPLFKALAIDFLGTVKFGQMRVKDQKTASFFVLPGSNEASQLYDGELKKLPMKDFIGGFAAPNVDLPLNDKKTEKKTKAQKTNSKEATFIPNQEPEKPKSLPSIKDQQTLISKCLSPSSKTCLLIILPPSAEREGTDEAVANFLQIHSKLSLRQATFPFYLVDYPASALLQDQLGLHPPRLDAIAVNGKKSWWRLFNIKKGFGLQALEEWIDGVCMDEGHKLKLPSGMIREETKDLKDEL